MVQLYVSQLRKAMAAHGGSDAIVTHGRGYELQLGRDRVDAGRFERLLAQGAAREALRLWRGPALADVADEPFAAAEIRRLEELRASALEVAIDQDLDAGRHREVLPELEALLAQEPLRERLHAQRMLALYRSGRQAEALKAYREARATLVEQIGVEPGPELRRLHEAILRQDPSLDPPGAGAGRRAAGRARRASCAPAAGSGAGLAPAPARTCSSPGRQGSEDAARAGARRRGAPRRWRGRLRRAEEVNAPTLLVLEDVAHGARGPAATSPVLAVATAVDGEGRDTALAPLGRDEVAALARYHAGRAPRSSRGGPPLAESDGVPARVHRAAAAWARAVATRRVGERRRGHRPSAPAGIWPATTSPPRSSSSRRSASAREPVGSDALPACPFKGLASFDVEDAPSSSAASGWSPT